jgi:anti-sigma B factor antagonist
MVTVMTTTPDPSKAEENAATLAPGGLPDSVTFAEVGSDVVVIRVKGRGNFANSFELKRIAEVMLDKREKGKCRFVVDLNDCETMDSTFMGQLASIGLRQRRENPRPLIVANPNAQNQRLMSTLGLSHFTEVHLGRDTAMPASEEFCTPEMQAMDRVDQITHMIEAHQKLCDVESGNLVRFESVLRYLNESLEKEKRGEH